MIRAVQAMQTHTGIPPLDLRDHVEDRLPRPVDVVLEGEHHQASGAPMALDRLEQALDRIADPAGATVEMRLFP